MTTILVAGDEFLRPELFEDALRVRPELDGAATIRKLELPWPTVPWSSFDGVEEAAGDERTVIEALRGTGDPAAEPACVLVTHLAPVTANVLAAVPELELVAVSRGGPVNVDLKAAARAGVEVAFAPGRNARAAAEFTVGMMLAVTRNLAAGHVALVTRDSDDWPGGYFRYSSAGFELGGSVVGLVGYGAIGHLVAGILLAFGSEVVAYDPYADPEKVHPGVRLVDDLPELMAASAVVSLHARLTPDTTGLIGAAELAMMPAGGVLVNTARGGLLDYDALCDALDSGHLAGAALDVFPTEPMPASARLFATPNLVVAPHIAGCSRDVAERAARICAGEVARWASGERPEHLATPPRVG